jgi:HAE1 family hydrophobic/amphiphilic exporter-1
LSTLSSWAGASLERTDAAAKKVRDVLQATPGVDIVGSISGLNFLTNAEQSNSAVEFAILKPWDERPPEQNASRIVAEVRPKLMAIPDAVALSFDPPSIPGLGATGGFEFVVEDLNGRGAMALNEATQALIAEARKQPELNPQQLFSSFSTSTPQYNYTSTAPRPSCSASPCRTCSTRCRFIWDRCMSTTSTCSAAPSG